MTITNKKTPTKDLTFPSTDSISLKDFNDATNFGSGYYMSPTPITGTAAYAVPGYFNRGVEPEILTKEDAISRINIKINELATQANRLARLREFFKSLNSHQQDIVKDFWEVIKKEID